MHTDTTSDSEQAGPIDAVSEQPRKAPGMTADTLRAANKVLDNYVASLRRFAGAPTDAASLS